MASIIEAAPRFAELQRYKATMFAGSAGLLALNYWLVVVRPRQCAPGERCHIDNPFMRFNRRLYWTSVAFFVVALAVTYGSLLVVPWLE